jgi:hypothetical protein
VVDQLGNPVLDPDFTLTTPDTCTDSVLIPGAVCSFTVNYSPSAASAVDTAHVEVVSVSPGLLATNPLTIDLSGSGVAPLLTFSGTSFSVADMASGTSDSHPVQVLNGTSVTYPTAPATLGASVIVQASPRQFRLVANGDGCEGASLVSGGTCSLSVEYIPLLPGTATATLLLGGPGGHAATLTGTSAYAAAAAAPLQLTSFTPMEGHFETSHLVLELTTPDGTAPGLPVLTGGTSVALELSPLTTNPPETATPGTADARFTDLSVTILIDVDTPTAADLEPIKLVAGDLEAALQAVTKNTANITFYEYTAKLSSYPTRPIANAAAAVHDPSFHTGGPIYDALVDVLPANNDGRGDLVIVLSSGADAGDNTGTAGDVAAGLALLNGPVTLLGVVFNPANTALDGLVTAPVVNGNAIDLVYDTLRTNGLKRDVRVFWTSDLDYLGRSPVTAYDVSVSATANNGLALGPLLLPDVVPAVAPDPGTLGVDKDNATLFPVIAGPDRIYRFRVGMTVGGANQTISGLDAGSAVLGDYFQVLEDGVYQPTAPLVAKPSVDVAVLLDSSGSTAGERRFHQLRTAAELLGARTKANISLSPFSFAGPGSLTPGYAAAPDGTDESVTPATALYDELAAALLSAPDAVVVFTDGEAVAGGGAVALPTVLTTLAGLEVPVYVIAYNDDLANVDTDLHQLADGDGVFMTSDFGAAYYQADDVGDLYRNVLAVGQRLNSTYWLKYTPVNPSAALILQAAFGGQQAPF